MLQVALFLLLFKLISSVLLCILVWKEAALLKTAREHRFRESPDLEHVLGVQIIVGILIIFAVVGAFSEAAAILWLLEVITSLVGLFRYFRLKDRLNNRI